MVTTFPYPVVYLSFAAHVKNLTADCVYSVIFQRTIVLPIDFPSEEVYEAYLRPVVDESMEQFQWGKPDLHSLRLYPL